MSTSFILGQTVSAMCRGLARGMGSSLTSRTTPHVCIVMLKLVVLRQRPCGQVGDTPKLMRAEARRGARACLTTYQHGRLHVGCHAEFDSAVGLKHPSVRIEITSY